MKNYKGGYKLIDLEKKDIMLELEAGVFIKGIHKAIESSYGKPLLLTGIVIDRVEKNDVYIEELKVVDGKFVFKAYGYEIIIDDDDYVEVFEIHVPVVKSVTSADDTKTIDMQDGDECLLSSTREDGTIFILPSECYLVGYNETGALIGVENHTTDNNTTLTLAPNDDLNEVYIKRIGNIILVSVVGTVI